MTLLFAGLLVFFGNGIVRAVLGMPLFMQVLTITGLDLALLLLFVPVLVTGDLESWTWKRPAALWWAWSPRRAFGDAVLPSGMPFALLLTALTLGLSLAAVHFSALPTLPITRSTGPLPPGRFGAALTAVTGAQIVGIMEQAGVMLTLVVVGISGLGFLLSVLLANRWSSLTLLYLALVLATALPYFSYGLLRGPDAAVAARQSCRQLPVSLSTAPPDPAFRHGASRILRPRTR